MKLQQTPIFRVVEMTPEDSLLPEGRADDATRRQRVRVLDGGWNASPACGVMERNVWVSYWEEVMVTPVLMNGVAS